MRLLTVDGRLGADAEVKVSKNGVPYMTFRMASNEWGDKEPMWFRVTTYDSHVINRMKQYLTKGKGVVVSGEYSDNGYVTSQGTFGIGRDITANYITFGNLMPQQEQSEGQQSTEIRQPDMGTIASTAPKAAEQPKATKATAAPKTVAAKVKETAAPQSAPQVAHVDEDDLPF